MALQRLRSILVRHVRREKCIHHAGVSARTPALLLLSACYGTSGPPPRAAPAAPPPPGPPTPLVSYAFHGELSLVKLDLANERFERVPMPAPIDDENRLRYGYRAAGLIDGRLYTCAYADGRDGTL